MNQVLALEFMKKFKNRIRFSINGDQVKIIRSPDEFYNELKTRSAEAKNRIILSALYLGSGSKERNLVEAIASNKFMPKVKILLDFFRGTRINTSDKSSSCTVLKPLLKINSKSSISLYHTPELRGIVRKLMPQRYNETIGLQHIKAYVFDDSIIISGANLSHDYFTNRQDRYILIKNCPKLADFFEKLISIISSHSFSLDSSGRVRWTCPSPHPYEDSKSKFINSFKTDLNKFLESSKNDGDTEIGDTLLTPSIQAGYLSIYDDSELTSEILQSGVPNSSFTFGTGYFNLTRTYSDILRQSKNTFFQVICAHPLANGFFGAKGPAGGIPSAYTLIASKFYDSLNGQKNRISLHEYQRSNWTFHGKGLWYSPNRTDAPILTMIGSPNFGYRSVERDLEAQLTILTSNKGLSNELKKESESLLVYSNKVDNQTFKQPERNVQLWVKIIVKFARNFF